MDNVRINDLSRALLAERSELVDVVGEVIDSGWLVHGPQHGAFESELADFVGAHHAVAVASGTDALELALRAAMPEGRSTVVTTANCGGYSATAARRAGFRVRYADVDRESLCLDAGSFARTVDESVGVVVVTHLYGRAADVAAVRAVAVEHGIRVLEDCAQAIGATTVEGRVGSLGDLAAFSFYPTKNLGALGDGGAVTTSDDALAGTVRELRQYGWQGKYTIGREGGRNSRLDELQAAVLRRRMRRLDADNARRRAIISAYAGAASSRLRVLPADGPWHVGHLAAVVTEHRDDLRAHLTSRGIGTDVHYPVPDHRQPAWAHELADVSLPVTEWAAERVLSVPVYPGLRDDEVERVCDALAEF
ncbi:DegT/DnrJ/EryC1/StrS family aminotransferase [Cellulomonas sp. 73-145]|uniref:DegT/DnrJ/EryC1/StrS family aminotransferase n=1 Tax=unclassified Cellulomonas TaxID=2620175 RepID=UPI001AC5FC03|nr:DegT/DnrJ/EryC1/StrS family aminotransferase [Cellulomonas sp. 73-145]MBN9327243.1 DegT/DnrJ/EryC1/StrS family aminotransferase [Cellulomonas sp.]